MINSKIVWGTLSKRFRAIIVLFHHYNPWQSQASIKQCCQASHPTFRFLPHTIHRLGVSCAEATVMFAR